MITKHAITLLFATSYVFASPLHLAAPDVTNDDRELIRLKHLSSSISGPLQGMSSGFQLAALIILTSY